MNTILISFENLAYFYYPWNKYPPISIKPPAAAIAPAIGSNGSIPGIKPIPPITAAPSIHIAPASRSFGELSASKGSLSPKGLSPPGPQFLAHVGSFGGRSIPAQIACSASCPLRLKGRRLWKPKISFFVTNSPQ
jgi:hypothetical protein